MDDRYLTQNKHDCINDFLQYKYTMDASESTIKIYSALYHRFFHNCFPDLAPEDVTAQHIQQFLNYIEEEFDTHRSANEKPSKQTKRTYVHYLSSFYSWALARQAYDQFSYNPAASVAQDIKTQPRDRPDCASWKNAKRVVHAIDDPRNRLGAVIMAKTGARVGETVRIQMQDVMLDDGFIRLRNRKGGGDSVVPIDEETIHQLKRYQVIRDHPSHEYLFVSRQSNPLSKTQLQDAVREAAIDVGIMDHGERDFYTKFTSHTFRTVFTTEMRRAGMSDHVLAYIRGDSDRTMRDHYTRIDRAEVREEYLECIKPLDLSVRR